MTAVRVIEPFEGYPQGDLRRFRAGEVVELEDAYADLVIGKGHAVAAAPARTKAVAGPGAADTTTENDQ